MKVTPSKKSPVSLLLLSGGVGSRSQHSEPKQFFELAGHPMIAHSIIAAIRVDRIKEIVVNAPEGFEERTEHILQSYCGGKPYKLMPPGKTRQESAQILAEAASHDTVIIHEAARPFVNKEMFQELIDNEAENVGFCYPIAFSMCRIDPKTRRIRKGVSREKVFDIQLPQKFNRRILLVAHEIARDRGKMFNEDAVLCVKMAGVEVLSLTGSSRNRKITTQEDFVIAEQMMKRTQEW
jgi:2-C-methyl-D-erythritol 4-phosphate cytidylyltransferase